MAEKSFDFDKILISDEAGNEKRLLAYSSKYEVMVWLDDDPKFNLGGKSYQFGKISSDTSNNSNNIVVLEDGLTTFNLATGDFRLYEKNGEVFFIYENGRVVYDQYYNIGSPPPAPTPETDTSSSTTTTQTTTDQYTDTATSTTIINNYYFINNTYITNVTNITVINAVENNYIYNNEYNVITNYLPGEVVRLNGEYQGIDLQGNSFFVKSSTGILEIQNSRDKFIGYSGDDGNIAAYSYVASGGGTVDGRSYSQAEILIGGDNADNQIYAGSGGSSLWGGNGGADTLVGGSGYDEFFYSVGSGNDVVQNANSNDVINLLGVSLSQISGVNVNLNEVNINFNDGGSLRVEGNSNVGYRLENQIYVCNQSTGQWSTG